MLRKRVNKKLSILMAASLLASLILPVSFVQANEPLTMQSSSTSPILSAIPLANSHQVRPNTEFEWQLDTSNKHFKEWNDKLQKHEVTFELLNDGGEAVFTGTDSELLYDPVSGKLTFSPPAPLERYTTYDAILSFKKTEDAQLHDPNRKKMPQQPPVKLQAVNEEALLANSNSESATPNSTALTPYPAPHIPTTYQQSSIEMSYLNKIEQARQQHVTNMKSQLSSVFVGPKPVVATNGSLHLIDVKEGQEQKGIIEFIDRSVVTLFGGRQFTVTPDTHIHLQDGPQSYTVADLHPGDLVNVTLDGHSAVKNINVKNNDGAYSTVFETGSALHEPTHVSVEQKGNSPRVTEDGHFTLVSTDDYGLPAWDSATQIDLATNDSTTLNESAHVLPQAAFTTANADGRTDVTVVDHAPQSVVSKISMNGPYLDGHDAHGLVVFFNFRPGLPATATMEAPPTMEVATVADVSGQVQDIYGNLVEDGTLINLQATAGTVGTPLYTSHGEYHTGYTAPTQVSDVTLSLNSVEGQATASRTIHLLPGEPALMTLSAPEKLPAGTDVTLHGNVTDRYGNAVLNGTPLIFSATAGTIAEKTQTAGGTYDVPFTAPTKVQTVTVSGASVEGTARADAAIQIVPGAPAQLTLQAEQDTLHTGDKTAVSGQVADQYGNLIPNQQVDMQTLFGSLSTSTPNTDVAGWFSTTYTAPFYNGTDTVTAQAGAATATLDLNISSEGLGYNPGTGQVEPVAQLVFEQPTYAAAPNQWVNVTFHAYNVTGQPLQNVVISASDANIGSIHSICPQTDVAGACQLTYLAPNVPGTAVLSVHSGTIVGQTTVNIFASGYGYDPSTHQWLPVGSIVFANANPSTNPGLTIQISGQVFSTTGKPLSNVQFDKLTLTGGQAVLPSPTDDTGKFTLTYTAPATIGNQVVQLSSGNATATATVQVTHDNMGYDQTNGTWVPVSSILFNPNQYTVLTNASVQLTGRVLGSNGHSLSLAKILISTDGGMTASQVVSNADGSFTLTYVAPSTGGTYHVHASTATVSGDATVKVVVPATPHLVNPSISLTGHGSGDNWFGTLTWGTKVLNPDGSPIVDQLFVIDNGDMNFLDYNFTDETGAVGGGPMQIVLGYSYTAYSGGRLVHYTTTTLRISNFDIDQWVYLTPSYSKTFTFSW